MIHLLFFAIFIFFIFSTCLCAKDEVPLLPERPIDRYIIYECLIFFWIFILALIMVIRMKLKETERLQQMGFDEEEEDVPFID